MASLTFFVNGKKISERHADPEWTVAFYLRQKLGLHGTKIACGEGQCGSCTVAVARFVREAAAVSYEAVNACLLPIFAVHGCAITTVEGLGSFNLESHPIQERLAKAHGSQCGFCTPGFVMSFYCLLRQFDKPTAQQIDAALQGNLCRCTGYRPILESFYTFGDNGCGVDNCCKTKSECCQNSNLTDWSSCKAYDPTQDPIFPPELKLSSAYDEDSLMLTGQRLTLHCPKSLSEFFALRIKFPDSLIIASGCITGISERMAAETNAVWLSTSRIDQLKYSKVEQNGVIFGAGLTITQLLQAVNVATDASFSAINGECLRQFQKRIESIFSVQLRNITSWVGNLAAGSSVSDLSVISLACKCAVELTNVDGTQRWKDIDSNFYVSQPNRKIDISPSEMITAIKIPISERNAFCRSYKQGLRRGNDTAIVNAAFYIKFAENSKTVEHMRLAFGGVGNRPILALQTVANLTKLSWNDQFLEEAIVSLSHEMGTNLQDPNSRGQYRISLCLSFFRRFYSEISLLLENGLPRETDDSNFGLPNRPEMKPLQRFQSTSEDQTLVDMVGRPLMIRSGKLQAAGDAQYVDDMPLAPNTAHCALVLSTRAHGRLLSVDTSAALRLPGVVAFVDHADVPRAGTNSPGGCFVVQDDSLIFAENTVTACGQTIGAIVAEDELTARRAVKLVKVEYDDLPAVLSFEEAIAAQSFIAAEPIEFARGDVDAAWQGAQRTLEGRTRSGGQQHVYMETQGAVVWPAEGDEWRAVVSTQSPSDAQHELCRILGCDAKSVVVTTKRIGGGFGGKVTQSGKSLWPAVVASNKLRRPIKLIQSRRDDFLNTGGRHPSLARYKVGFSNTGKLEAIDIEFYLLAGNFVDTSQCVLFCGMNSLDFQYALPADSRLRGWACRTNTPSNNGFRCFGQLQGGYVIDAILERIAETLGKAPDEVRQLNLQYPGYRRLTSEDTVDETSLVQRCWDECARWSEFEQKKRQTDEFNSRQKDLKRGVALTPVHWPFSLGYGSWEQGAALVHIYTDGSVLISHGGVEMGQGLNTKCLQVAGRVLRLPQHRMTIIGASTDKVPNTIFTAGSLGTDIYCPAVKDACEKLMTRLHPFMQENEQGSWEDWVKAAFTDRVSLSATGFALPPRDMETNPNGPRYYISGAACTQVEIDCLTGDHQVLSTDIVMDLGASMNPAVDIGQIEGAFVQGQGFFTTEEVEISEGDGQIKTNSLGSYKIPTATTIPREFRVALLQGSSADNIYSSKAVGEPPMALSTSVFFALSAAVRAARGDRRLPPAQLDSPLTAETIRLACADSLTQAAADALPLQ